MKIIAFYLPQFHEIPENNAMWGIGFTEWTNVRKAKPLFDGHAQPVEPLDNNYYNLLDTDVMKWQTRIAKEYGIYGFCFYHYWYNGHKLLEKPVELYLNKTEIDFPYCICWANHDWTTSWADNETRIIYQYDYNDKHDWDNHFYYLLPFFKDSRYISINGNPLVVIYEAALPLLDSMLDRWQELARKEGFSQLEFAYQSVNLDATIEADTSKFSYDIEYQPQYVRELIYKKRKNKKRLIAYQIEHLINRLHCNLNGFRNLKNIIAAHYSKLLITDYDDTWEKVLAMDPVSEKSIPGAFVRMDTTPRMKNRGFVTQGMTPEKFKKYMKRQIIHCREDYKKDMIFLFAWNEWAEGGYLEPDKRDGYKVLEALKEALEETGEFPY